MTAEAAGPAVDITGLPSWTLNEGQLGDLELLLAGAFAPLTGFLGPADVAQVTGTSPRSLRDFAHDYSDAFQSA